MIEVRTESDVAIITLARPPANAIDERMLLDLDRAIKSAENSAVKAVVLTGQGDVFSAGVDLIQLQKGGQNHIESFLHHLDRLLTSLFFFPKPVVAAVNGHAIAGGCVIANCADQRLMADLETKIGVPELRVGVPFPVIITEIIRAKVKQSSFEEILLTGATYTPKQAKKVGLIDRVVAADALLEKAIQLAASLGSIGTEIYALTKQQARQPVKDLIDTHGQHFSEKITSIWLSEQTSKAIDAYVKATFAKT